MASTREMRGLAVSWRWKDIWVVSEGEPLRQIIWTCFKRGMFFDIFSRYSWLPMTFGTWILEKWWLMTVLSCWPETGPGNLPGLIFCTFETSFVVLSNESVFLGSQVGEGRAGHCPLGFDLLNHFQSGPKKCCMSSCKVGPGAQFSMGLWGPLYKWLEING